MKKQQIKRTFIVDDDPFWTSLLSKILTSLGYENIISFSNGKDCIDHLHLNPQLVFLDHQLDDIDGIEVLQKIKQYYPGIGVIFCTAHEDLSVAVNAMKFGSFDYLLKSNGSRQGVADIIDQMHENNCFAQKIY